MDWNKEAIDYHSKGRRGKIEVVATKPMLTQRDLSLAYTPGVAVPCRIIEKDPDAVYELTAKGNLVGVVSNGTAVLGLGDIGPMAGKPVMEGKANLFKKFADIDVFDIELDAPTPDEVVAAVKALAPTFGGINLEDIKAPECFEIEERLQSLDIPVFHDDQHGTAIICNAALLNACHITGRKLEDLKFVISGAGAAAVACCKLAEHLGARNENIYMCDSKGLITTGRGALPAHKAHFAKEHAPATLAEILPGADVFLGLSVGGLLSQDMVRSMAPQPILFAMANPDPEISYGDAKAAVPDSIIATGRSDFPNQVNNVLGFPFIFRGALDCRASAITIEMKVAAVKALANLARQDVPDQVLHAYQQDSMVFGTDYIIPKPFDPRVLTWVAPAVAQAAAESGVARRPIEDIEAYRQHLERMVERTREVVRPLMNRARSGKRRRIVFSEGYHSKILRAAQILVDEGICQPVLIGHRERIEHKARENRVSLEGMEIVEIEDGARVREWAQELLALRNRKGLTTHAARRWLRDPVVVGLMMVRRGEADALLGGLGSPYSFTIRPALKILGRAADAKVISGVYALLQKDRRLYFGDCTVNAHMTAEKLAQVAINTARTAQMLGDEPHVAMLSYSDFGDGRGDPKVDMVSRAVELVREAWPELHIDGEMQADTALSPSKCATDYPWSQIQGDANVLIFPDLDSANIAYKLMKEVGGAIALGPILEGMPKPVNVLAIDSTVSDIVNMAAISVTQACRIEQKA